MQIKKQLPQLLLCAIVVILFYANASAQKKIPKYKVGFNFSIIGDFDYGKPGLAAEFGISKKIYKKFYARLWYHKSNSHNFSIPRNKWYGFTSFREPYPDPSIVQDIYASYFVGKPAADFFGSRYTTYNKNVYTFNFAVNKECGRGKLKFIPEVGFSIGHSQSFSFFLKEIASTNGIITGAFSQANFYTNMVYGLSMSFSLDYQLKNNLNLQFNIREYLNTTRTTRAGSLIGEPYYAVCLGFTITKSFNSFKLK
jgi:hypothetical protein